MYQGVDGGHGMNWQPIETAPRDGTYILLWFNGEPYPFHAGYYCDFDKMWVHYGSSISEPNYWCEVTPPVQKPTAEPSQ